MKMKSFLSILCLVVALAGCEMAPASDVGFAKYVFTNMARGRQAIEKYIDWQSFQAVGVDVGATYSKFSEKERPGYRKAFLQNFSFSFRSAGGKLSYFHNWRIHSRDSHKVIVSVDTKNLTLLLSLSQGSRAKRKLIAMEWLKQ
jgi:hypothetical protein